MVKLGFIAGAALIIIPGAFAADPVVEITPRYNIQVDIVRESQLIGGNMIPVGTRGDGYWVRKDSTSSYRGQPGYHFYMQDDQRNRVEFSSAYTLRQHITPLSFSQRRQHIAAKSLYHFGAGIAGKGEAWVYEYGLWLPSSLNGQSKGIISQWHGIPDRTTVVDAQGNMQTYTLDEFNKTILGRMSFKKNIGYDLKTGKRNGYRVDQGGYPPVSLKIGDGYLYVLVRSDFNKVTDKTDRVNINPGGGIQTRYSPGKSKTVTLPFMKKLSDLPAERWLDMKWVINWSEFAAEGQWQDGSVTLFINGQQQFQWNGPVGNNDKAGTYFKYGIYKPGSSGIEVRLAGFTQSRISP